MPTIDIINMEFGLPRADEARRRLATEVELARRRGVRVLKIIHGYGSSGRGGKLRSALRAELRQFQARGFVTAVVTGEAWSIFDDTARDLLARYPELSRDRDLERGNPGVTLVELPR